MKPRDEDVLKSSPCERLETKVLQLAWNNKKAEYAEPLQRLSEIAVNGYEYGWTEKRRYFELKATIHGIQKQAQTDGNMPVVRLMKRFENYINRIERQATENDLLN